MNGKNRPRVLLNASTIMKGGGIQAVVSFICTLMTDRDSDDLDWYLAVSPVVNQQLEKLSIRLDPKKDIILQDSPSKSRNARKVLQEYIEQWRINCIFTFFGPAYLRFSVPHICGVADGWVTHSDWEAFSKIPSWHQRLKMLLLCLYKGLWLRSADAWFVEQEAARRGLGSRLGINKKDVNVIANNCADHYRGYNGAPLLDGEQSRVLIFASYYPNKNIESVPYIVQALEKTGQVDVEFILTIKKEEPGLGRVMKLAKSLGVDNSIRNIGPVDVLDGPALYRSCKILLMPSILETFSAVYPEAMSMGLPIVTTDKAFSRSICANAASYYRSDSPADAARTITKLLSDEKYYNNLVAEGTKRLQFFPDIKKKYQLLHDMVSKYAN